MQTGQGAVEVAVDFGLAVVGRFGGYKEARGVGGGFGVGGAGEVAATAEDGGLRGCWWSCGYGTSAEV